MQIVTIEYARTRQVAQYEPESLKLTANLAEGEDHLQAMHDLRIEVNSFLMGRGEPVKMEETPKEEADNGEAQQASPKAKKKTTKKKATKKTSKAAKKVEEKAEVEFTREQVKEWLVKVVKARGMSVANDILNSFGADHSSKVKEEDFNAVVAECEKVLS